MTENNPTDEKSDEAGKKSEEFLRKLSQTLYAQFIREVNASKENPRMLVLVTHGIIELLVNTMVDARCKHSKRITDNNRDFPHSAKLVILNEMQVLSDHHHRLLDWFRKLRNDAAHQPFFKLEAERLDFFVKTHHRNPDQFYLLCHDVILDLLTSYNTMIAPILTHTLVQIEDKPVLMVETPFDPGMIPLKSDPKTLKMTADEFWAKKPGAKTG